MPGGVHPRGLRTLIVVGRARRRAAGKHTTAATLHGPRGPGVPSYSPRGYLMQFLNFVFNLDRKIPSAVRSHRSPHRRRARVGVEAMEGRSLLTAGSIS